MTTSSSQTAAVIYNPIKVDLDALRDAVESSAREAGWGESVWLETSVDDVGQDVTKQAARLSRPEEIELDGDGFGKATAFDACIEPGALKVRVPADAA